MKHFEIEQWSDFVRGLSSANDRTTMAEHLSSGCAACRRTVELLSAVAVAAGAESASHVPEAVIRQAKAIFAVRRQELPERWPHVLARLVYDSFREPVPAGLRSEQRFNRHALYEAGEFCLDFRLEYQQGSPRVTLVGQIADRRQPARPVGGALVLLTRANDVLGRAIANELGEFQMEYEPKKRLKLFVMIERDPSPQIAVPLDEIMAHQGSAGIEGKA